MPTGYTADLKDGISFKTYALNCARAFGACVTLRDEPGGGENIPDEFTPSDYNAKAAQKARDELAALLNLTPDQRERRAAKAWDEAETSRLMRLEDKRKQREAYEAMLAKVNAWTPPTPEHAGLHEFMRTQIEQSIDFDCGGDYGKTPTPRLTGDQWSAQEAARLNRDIGYHEKEHAAECKRAADRTAWVRALRAAL
jgi:monoamine oxidase